MENINFIPANNLPVAEGDEVSVLCLENGEMKQKPANGLGGGSWDAVITTTDFHGGSAYTLMSGSFEAIVKKLLDRETPKISVVLQNEREDGFITYTSVAVTSVSATNWDDGVSEVEIYMNLANDDTEYVCMTSDGSIYID